MKSIIVTSIAASSLFAGLAIAEPASYTVIDLGTLGGTYSYGYGINNAGWVSGGAATPTQTDGVSQTAFLWSKERGMQDLGTLGGPSSEAGGPNASGESAIISETSMLDPLNEDFCAFGTHKQCLGAIWKHGAMTALPTLKGGHNAAAYWLNNQGQVVGFSENGTLDSTCSTPFQKLRFEPVIWGRDGEIQALPLLKGDTVGWAWGSNDNGQVVGSSGLCSIISLPPANPVGQHAVLWDRDGSPTDLGNLGMPDGSNIANSVNNRGEVVGTAPSSTDGNIHAFLWTKHTGMQDLGTLPGAVVTVTPCCHTINNKGEVVGWSIDGTTGNQRAVIWQDKVPLDLNTLIPAGSGWYLQAAQSINDAGEIAGFGLINGNVHAFLAVPCNSDQADSDGCEDDR
jgi:probable HAF family extracellular repeat protein